MSLICLKLMMANAIGTRYIELAKEDMRRWMINLPDQDLA